MQLLWENCFIFQLRKIDSQISLNTLELYTLINVQVVVRGLAKVWKRSDQVMQWKYTQEIASDNDSVSKVKKFQYVWS